MKERVELLQRLLMACELSAAATGLLHWFKFKNSITRAFFIYLLFIALTEQLGWYLKHNNYKPETSALYTYVIIPAEFIFAYWFINKSSSSSLINKLCLWFTGLGIVINISEIVFLQKEKFFFSSLAYLAYNLFLVVLVLVFFYYFIRSDKIIKPLNHFNFWVCTAYLLYYLTTFPLYAFYNLLYKKDKDVFFTYWQTQMFLNMAMYLIFAIGIIWTNRRYKS